jgi:hypothetical protein
MSDASASGPLGVVERGRAGRGRLHPRNTRSAPDATRAPRDAERHPLPCATGEGALHALAVERQHLEFATLSALDERTDDDGRRSGVTVNRPASKAYSVRRVMSERVL